MKCSETESIKAKNRALDLLNEFNPLKDTVNDTRASIGLELIPDLKDIDILYT